MDWYRFFYIYKGNIDTVFSLFYSVDIVERVLNIFVSFL